MTMPPAVVMKHFVPVVFCTSCIVFWEEIFLSESDDTMILDDDIISKPLPKVGYFNRAK